MVTFIRDYGTKQSDGSYALGTTFISVTASLIYVGELLGALFAAPINDQWGRKAAFGSASCCVIVGAIMQPCSLGMYSVFCVGRVLIGLGIGPYTATCLIYISEVALTQLRGLALMMLQFMQSCSQLVVACIDQGTESINNAASYRIPMGLLIVLPATMLTTMPRLILFFLTVWLMVFVSPYLYYTANLGPMLGFIYAGTTIFALTYVWFCVGETAGRSNMESDRLFIERVPVTMWRTYVFASSTEEHEMNVEKQQIIQGVERV
ncbi:hypothetical protein AbraIFM66950_002206 [Aspergillus brasiliensis]|nr:hypothetical protein AbraIFM66950_002206 [Aspergillus brasiliensis]